MQRLHNLTRQTVNLSIRQNDNIVYIDRIMRERPGIQVVRTIGATAPPVSYTHLTLPTT